MTNLTVKHRVRVHDYGTLTPTDGTVAFTWAGNTLATVPEGSPQVVDVLNARVESPGVQFQLLATATVLGQLADAGGRLAMLRRVVEWQTSPDSTTWTTIFTGRLARIDSPEFTGRLGVLLRDEREIERTTDLFVEAGKTLGNGDPEKYAAARVWPPGIDGAYGGFEAEITLFRPPTDDTVFRVGNLARVRMDNGRRRDGVTIFASRSHLQFLEGDLIADLQFATDVTAGNFEHLRARVNGTEYEVFSLGSGTADRDTSAKNRAELVNGFAASLARSSNQTDDIWVVDPGTTLTGGASVSSAVLIAPTHEPTESFPAYIGGRDGMTIGQFLEDVYDEMGERFDSAAIQALKDDLSLPRVRFLKTAREQADRVLTEDIYHAFLILPFINGEGELAPARVTLPTADQVSDPGTLFRFTGSNAGKPHPTWAHAGDQQATVLDMVWSLERLHDPNAEEDRSESGGPAPDFGLVVADDHTITHKHDRVDDFGSHPVKILARGIHRESPQVLALLHEFGAIPQAERWALFLKQQLFARFGDGAVPVTIEGMSATNVAATDPGKFVVIDVPTFAEWGTGVRGTPRIVQILSKTRRPSGKLHFTGLDVGAESQPLAAPTVSVVKNTAEPKHALDVTISSLPTGAGYELQVRKQGGVWGPATVGDADETVTIQPVASGTTWEARARAVRNARITSAWSTVDTATTDSLTDPTLLAESNVTAGETDLGWTDGETDYLVEVLLDEAACAASTRVVIDRVAAGQETYHLDGLNAATYCAGVRHVDPYGGASSEATVEWTAAGANNTPDAPRKIEPLTGVAF